MILATWRERVRVAHLSDLHLRYNLPGDPQPTDRFGRLVPQLLTDMVSKLRELKPDLLLLTGDLLDYPQSNTDDELREQALLDLLLLQEIVLPIDCPVLAIAGNHDPSADLVSRVFGRPTLWLDGQFQILFFHDFEDEQHVSQRVGDELARFESALTHQAWGNQVHVQHYLVWPDLQKGYPYAYREAPTFYEKLVRSGHVFLVLSGHYHRGIEPRRRGDTWFSVAPAFCTPPHACWLYDLHSHQRMLSWQAVTVET